MIAFVSFSIARSAPAQDTTGTIAGRLAIGSCFPAHVQERMRSSQAVDG
jgi:hypothetical protein